MEMIRKVLTIAGSDSSGGAGIQADLKTMLANGVYGMSAITALTAQNTQGVRMVQEATPEFLTAELDAVFEDIRPDAVKVGMVASPALIHVIAEKLQGYGAEHVVVDPGMVATSGAKLLADDAVEVLVQEIFPLGEVITPNIPELSVLTGQEIADEAAFQRAAEHLAAQVGVNVLAKGGHSAGEASDLLVMADGKGEKWYRGTRVENPNTHGTGCTLSSAIAANLAKGFDLAESIGRAKSYLFGALLVKMDLGTGSGPVDHSWNLHGDFFEN